MAARAGAMALSKLSGDEQCIIFSQLCNTLDPGVAVAFGSISNELRALTPALLQQLRNDYEAATALCRKVGVRSVGMRSCKELREAKRVFWNIKGHSSDDLALLGTLGSVLPAVKSLTLYEPAPGPERWQYRGAGSTDGVQRLAERLSAGALPALTVLKIDGTHVGDAGASALAAALGRGALPRLEVLELTRTAIGDAGLVALAPALRRLPALDLLALIGNPYGDEGIAALVAPLLPPPAGALPPPTGVLKKLRFLSLLGTQIADAGCAALAFALDSGALPALKTLDLDGIQASDAAKAGVTEALARSRAAVPS